MPGPEKIPPPGFPTNTSAAASSQYGPKLPILIVGVCSTSMKIDVEFVHPLISVISAVISWFPCPARAGSKVYELPCVPMPFPVKTTPVLGVLFNIIFESPVQ